MDTDGYFSSLTGSRISSSPAARTFIREIEEVLFEHPGVEEAAVVGVPHPYGGEIAKAFIVPKPGVDLSSKN
jgi:long-chain acyl-CoA synthetase